MLAQRICAASPEATVTVVEADLADHDSISVAAQKLNGHSHIDLFHNNAGVLLGERKTSKHGIEMHAQVNTVAPYLFRRLLHTSLEGSTVAATFTGGI